MAALPWAADAPPVQADAWSDVRKLMLISVLGSRATGENASEPADGAEELSQAAEDMTVDIEREPVTIKVGDRIEVQWQLTDEQNVEVVRWWGATVSEEHKDAGDAGTSHWDILYEAYGSFAAETVRVDFITQRCLRDLKEQTLLVWRAEGEDWEPSPESDDEDVDNALATIDMRELGAISREAEARLGCSVEEAALQEMQQRLSVPQQQAVAAGFDEFVTSVVESLKRKAQARQGGAENVISAQDIREAVDSFKKTKSLR